MRQGWQAALKDLRRDWLLYAMLAPTLIWFLVFLYMPLDGLQLAFKQYSAWKGIDGSPWVGFAHFVTLFQSEQFLRAVGNTLIISAYSIVLAFPVPILLALMINEVQSQRYRKAVQTIVYLPHFISVVIVAGIVVAFLSPTTGVVNNALEFLGLDRIYFLTRPEWFRSIFIGSNIWKEAGFDSIVFLAAIMSINPALYESAQVDGASRWQMMTRITLPCIVPTIAVLLVIRLGRVLEVGFEYIILLYQPSTFETADVISTYIYRQGLQGARYDLATAAGVFNAVVALVLVLVANRLSRRITRTGVF
ncbi:MAG: sugar ABC transporter permease [Candidatus Dactylopiibacterium carminicum]|uniref:Sugar ABC transporter permease n=1 Tax=Candidatus Dactylopiibacterium carminicum TaxID=857335 RepID=A0A272ESB1_9RHOO|nr:sugar ABC transporter permease [Candidatus Dactylopiibacterium carminicum]PAS93003.1 MAG: sugar ABC transporter permease [Candidatus Dactylopiibacterium carminicum]PAS96559.1 MAG: sugar ABC transporter permease [Candidatus Dactylopiibacterium carminicum]PAT00773.1 MAG: sugar ABC transporter permease [Candidatus Dactylopiibacterium carminicum]